MWHKVFLKGRAASVTEPGDWQGAKRIAHFERNKQNQHNLIMVEAVEEVLDPFLKISCLLLIFYCGNSIHSCGRVAGSMPYREGRRSLQTSLAAPNSNGEPVTWTVGWWVWLQAVSSKRVIEMFEHQWVSHRWMWARVRLIISRQDCRVWEQDQWKDTSPLGWAGPAI